MPTFRLDQEPWIPVVATDGSTKEVSLTGVFTGAAGYSGLAGSPLEVAALSRFLIAIAHLTDTPTSLQQWSELWSNRADLMRRCAAYVETQGDAWDLLHKTHPFGQLLNDGGTPNPAHILVYDAARKNNAVFLNHSIADAPAVIPLPALARGLLVTNAYGGSSGGGYRSGPLAMRSTAMVTGQTLDESLVLNLLVQPHQPSAFDWRTYGHLKATGDGAALDIVRRYLWTSRTVRLTQIGPRASVCTIMLAPGNNMPEVERAEDPMVVFRKDAKGTAYVPLRLEADRALWRSAHVLLSQQADSKPLAALTQLNKLVVRGYVSADHQVSLRVCAVAGEAQGPSTELWRDEKLPFGFSILTDDRRYAELCRAVDFAETMQQNLQDRLWSFARRYLGLDTEGRPKGDPKKEAEEVRSFIGKLVGSKKEKWGKETVTIPIYTDFWSAIASEGERIASDGFNETAWVDQVQMKAGDEFRRAVDRLPPNAQRYRSEFVRRGPARDKKGVTA